MMHSRRIEDKGWVFGAIEAAEGGRERYPEQEKEPEGEQDFEHQVVPTVAIVGGHSAPVLLVRVAAVVAAAPAEASQEGGTGFAGELALHGIKS